MKRAELNTLIVLSILLVLPCCNSGGQDATGQSDSGTAGTDSDATIQVTIEDDETWLADLDYASDRLIAQVLPGTLSDVESIANSVGAQLARFDEATRSAILSVSPDQLSAAAQALAGLPEIESVEKDYLLPADRTPSDPSYSIQWHLPMIGAPGAWDVTTGDAGLIVAVVDTGIDSGHADLRDGLIGGFNFIGGNTDASDCCGHGTGVAGSVSAAGNDGVGVTGVTWAGKIMPIRVARREPAGVTARTSDIASGILWAVDHGASVINVSFSGVLSSSAIQQACQYAVLNGRVVVASMGNTGQRDAAADSPWTISVSATDTADGLASFSTYGPGVDLGAPGVNIYTTAMGGGYEFVSGTSFSSPITCGVVALMRSIRPEALPSQIESMLLGATDDVGSPGADERFGQGRLNARKAVEAARDATLPNDATPPTIQFTSPRNGSTIAGRTRIDLIARDDTHVRDVALLFDGREVARDTSAPHAFLVDPGAGPAGPHRISAIATDVSGNQSAEAAITLTFDAQADTTPPDVTIEAPAQGSTLSGRVPITARMSDPAGLKRVSVLLDEKVIASADLSGSAARAEFSWNASAAGVRPDSHVIGVRVENAAGLLTMATVNVVTTR